jgi:glutamyl-tRNA reductase
MLFIKEQDSELCIYGRGELLMQYRAPEVVSIADVCLGGLRGRSALVIGPEEQRYFYVKLLRRAGMKCVYQEDTPFEVSSLLPSIQLLISIPPSSHTVPWLTAASIAKGCNGRRTPLLILDLAPHPSVEELAGLLPAVCLYTPDDLNNVLNKTVVKAS